MPFYDLYSVYDEDHKQLLATFEVQGDDEEIVRYFPPDGQEREDWLQEAATEGWTTQEFLRYFTRGDLVRASDPKRRSA